MAEKRGCIVQRGACIKREPLSRGESWEGVVFLGSMESVEEKSWSQMRLLIEPSLPYHWVDTPWGRGVHVHGETLELPT